jgi:signal transduction histidine kinase
MPGFHNELINLSEKIKEVVLLFENTHNVSIVFHTSVKHELQVIADKDQLGRAIINLIKNGIQSIPKDRVGVLRIGMYNDLEWAYISVCDNGSGIPVELHDKLFVPSFTTKSSGMGLGLAITKRIIENFKGVIWFESNPDVGTTFYIKLPITGF